MEALLASYGDSDSDSNSDSVPSSTITNSDNELNYQTTSILPPPPISLLTVPSSHGTFDYSHIGQAARVRRFPHVDGNYALYVYIPVYIPLLFKTEINQFLKKLSSLVSGLLVVDMDVPINIICKDDDKFNQVALGRKFHISLGRTVPIRVHQIDSVVTMLRQKLQPHRRYWIDFSRWEVFVNDDQTRSFLSMEVIARGLAEITKHIGAVNEVYKLHNLPEFYKDPRPHISICWASGDISNCLKGVVQEEVKRHVTLRGYKNIFSCKFSGIECRIGNKTHKICTVLED